MSSVSLCDLVAAVSESLFYHNDNMPPYTTIINCCWSWSVGNYAMQAQLFDFMGGCKNAAMILLEVGL